MGRPRKEITIGKEYGWLTVISEAPRDAVGHIRWNVKCRCGKEYTVLTSFLSKKEPKCRECYDLHERGKVTKPRKSKVGDVINGWKIVKEVGKNDYGAVLYECKCLKCGTVSVHTRGDLISRKGAGCQHCPPNFHFRVVDGIAIGTLPNGIEFKIDASQIDRVSQYHWNVKKEYIERTDSGLEKALLHRFVLGLDSNDTYIVDHISRDKMDCSSANLRIVTSQQNAMNKSIQKNNTTGYVGVCYLKNRNTYLASIGFNNRKISLGTNKDPIVCAQMYNYASKYLFGEYVGHRNEVPEPSNKIKKHIEEKCRPFTLESLIARQPVIVPATA